MDNGYVILSIVALLFLSMYIFANVSVALENMKLKKIKENELVQEALEFKEKVRRQQIRDEKVSFLNKRKEEIREEMGLLELMKQKQMEHRKVS